MTLLLFHGTCSENVRAWISIVTDQLHAMHMPHADWAVSLSRLFWNEVLSWYLTQKLSNGDQPLTCFYFLHALPQPLAFHILTRNPTTMAKVYDVARKWDCHQHAGRLSVSNGNQQSESSRSAPHTSCAL
ncbi:unnamed protein product [Mycena citricolor]|uniref:Uncharacterized protein n=1 Tax=Mycena citricolor TaxID=2018698 RepID=A0AAD2H5A8_9AGAR|nr:unnamed protein product [Mycena citricolor]